MYTFLKRYWNSYSAPWVILELTVKTTLKMYGYIGGLLMWLQ